MPPIRPRFTAEPLTSSRLALEPLLVEHAAEAATAFDDPQLHTYIGGAPATSAELRSRFARQTLGHSADGSEDWLNWMVRDRASGVLAGTVQATVHHSGELHDGVHLVAEVSWVVAMPFQGRGLAIEAAGILINWLREHGVDEVIAHVHPGNQPSIGVARRLGLRATSVVVEGEHRWSSALGEC